MENTKYILAIDQGTSATKTILFDEKGSAIIKTSVPQHTFYLDNGFVEQDAQDIYNNVIKSIHNCIEDGFKNNIEANNIQAIAITNQRETFVLWDKNGKPFYNAIVWQCKRSIKICEELKQKDLAEKINSKTGLFIDPYFSATKLMWLVQNNVTIAKAVTNNEVFFGTIDTWLLYKLTNGKVYETDYTNASRTMLFNLHTLQWDDELINLFGLSGINLPTLKPSSTFFGQTNCNSILSKQIPITSLIGDSHAAAFGEGCFKKGIAKATLGTGSSILMNIGSKPVTSTKGMVTTICWSTKDRIDYALEGVIISCGSTIEWLKNELNLFANSSDTTLMANAIENNGGVYLVPAFSGLGSPYWDMECKASLIGITFSSTKNHLVRAALESIPYQIKAIIDAMEEDASLILEELSIDGGITTNQFVVDFLTNLLQKNVSAIDNPDVSALGAAYLAGLEIGVYKNINSIEQLNTNKKIVKPNINNKLPLQSYQCWKKAIEKR